jgi:integrase
MPRVYDPNRRCLKVAEWPKSDRRAWDAALASGHPLVEVPSSAAAWRPATMHKNRRGYGRWLGFLTQIGVDLTKPVADRVTPDRVRTYVDQLTRQSCSSYTIRNRIGELLAVMVALAPGRDWSWLRRWLTRLDDAAKTATERPMLSILANEVLAAARRSLDRLRGLPGRPSAADAIRYRDWFIIACLTMIPLRRRNFCALELGRHVVQRSGSWFIEIPGAETKTRRPYHAPIPGILVSYLEHYLEHIRPVLLGVRQCEALWIARSGKPMKDHTINLRITALTAHALGTPLSLHDFRSLTASTLSLLAPDMMDGGRAQLGHASRRTTQHHYVRANAIQASRAHARLIQRLRNRSERP